MSATGWDVSYRRGRLDRRRLFAAGNVSIKEASELADYLVEAGYRDVRVTLVRVTRT